MINGFLDEKSILGFHPDASILPHRPLKCLLNRSSIYAMLYQDSHSMQGELNNGNCRGTKFGEEVWRF